MASENKWRSQDDDGDEEEEDEVDTTQYQNLKDAILFAIHVSPSMLSTHSSSDDDDEDGDEPKKKKKNKSKPTSAVRTALQCAYEVLQQRIISNPNDMMGILLFGTEETKFSDGASYKHCYLLMDLDIPDAASIKTLKNLIEDEEAFNEIIVPSEEPVSMPNVLFGANQIFTTKAANFQSRRLFLITDNDNPHGNDRALKNSAITRARDLYDLGVRIDPFYISNPGAPEFDPSKFYEDIIYRPGGEEDNDDDTTAVHLKPTSDGTLRLQEMITSIRSKASAKRALFSIKLELAPGLEIGIKGYAMYKRQEKSRSHYVYMGGEAPQIVKGETTLMAADTARAITEKADIKKAYKFGGEVVLFTPDELKEIRNFGPPGLRVIGFKPASALRFMDNVRPATFIYPSEAEFVGSTRVFAALHKKLQDSDKIGIGWFISRRNATPSLVALYPTPAPSPSPDAQKKDPTHPPEGIFLIPLPFANDIRQNPETTLVRAPDPLIDAMRAIVKQLHMPKGYQPAKFANPALQWHYRILQAIALDEEVPEPLGRDADPTRPRYRLIRKYAGEKVLRWGRELEGSVPVSVAVEAGAAKKRGRGAEEKGGDEGVELPVGKKRAVKEEGGEGLKDEEMRRACERGQVNKFTVVQLKGWLAGKRLEVGGKKADLVDRVEAWCEKH